MDEQRAIQWMMGGDTGISSKAIWGVMMGTPPIIWWEQSPPLDPDDFGRCYRLLALIPNWRPRLAEVSALFPQWQRIVDHWADLEALYQEEVPNHRGNAPRLYSLMRKLDV